MTDYILITGTCGTGKTWVMKELIKLFGVNQPVKQGLYHWVYSTEEHLPKSIAILGKYDGTMFEGSDRLAMNIMAQNMEAKAELDVYDVVIAEGDRFTNASFIRDFKPRIIRIKGDGKEGRKARGSSQTERQIKSITTRVNNITPHYVVNGSEDCLNFVSNLASGKVLSGYEYTEPKTTLF
jgi:hypothetical protein